MKWAVMEASEVNPYRSTTNRTELQNTIVQVQEGVLTATQAYVPTLFLKILLHRYWYMKVSGFLLCLDGDIQYPSFIKL